MATIKKVVDRIGNIIYPVTHAQAVIGIGGKTVYENIEELMGGGSSGINLLPTILDVVFLTSDIESNPLPQDAEDGSYAIGDDHLFRMVDGSWEMQENPKYFFFKYDNIMYSYTDGTWEEKFDFGDPQVQSDWNQNTNTEPDYIKNKPTNLSDFTNDLGFLSEKSSIVRYLSGMDGYPANPVSGDYAYINEWSMMGSEYILYKYNGTNWIHVSSDDLPDCYFIYGNTLYKWHNESLTKEADITITYCNNTTTTGLPVGALAINTTENKLYKKTVNSFEEVDSSSTMLYVVSNLIYRGTGSSTLTSISGGGGGSIVPGNQTIYFTNGENFSTQNATNGTFGTNDGESTPKGINLAPLFAGVTEDIAAISLEDYRKNLDEENERLYPEYWYEEGYADQLYNDKVTVWKDNYRKRYKENNPSATKSNIINAANNAWAIETAQQEEYRQQANSEAHAYCANHPIVYAKNYYDWNTVVYKDDINEEKVLVSAILNNYDGSVVYPTEYLAGTSWFNNEVAPDSLTTRDVYYHTVLGSFVLKVGNSYYKKWNNSNLWQKDNGTLRNDTIYSRIELGDHWSGIESDSEEVRKTVTWLVKAGVRTNVVDTFTNFSLLIKRTLLENGGKCRLHSTKIYGMATNFTVSTSNGLYSIDFDGQNGIICAVIRATYREEEDGGTSNALGAFIGITNIPDVSISNVKILATKNAIRNSASGIPMSYSNSNLYGIQVDAANSIIKDVRIKNVQFKGCNKDMRIGGSKRVNKTVIEDWKSDSTEGLFVGAIENLIIDRADLIQGEYSSAHIIYCGDVGNAQSHVIKNSRFIQNSIFNSNFIQYKIDSETATPSPKRYVTGDDTSNYIIANLKFINCHMRVGRGMMVYSPFNELRMTIDRCTILQHDKFITKNGKTTIGYWGDGNLNSMAGSTTGVVQLTTRCSLRIVDSVFKVWNRPIFMNNTAIWKYNVSPATPEFAHLDMENVQLLLNAPNDYYTTHVYTNDAAASRAKLILIWSEASGLSFTKKLTRRIVNVNTNYIPPVDQTSIPGDTVTVDAKAKGSDFVGRSIGFSYYNTTLNKPVWLTENVGDYHVWSTVDGDEYSDIQTAVTSAAAAPTGATVQKGYVYDNTEIDKRVVLFDTDHSTNIWVDNDWNAYLDDGTSVPTATNGEGLENESVGYFFLNLTLKDTLWLSDKVTINGAVYYILRNYNSENNTCFNPNNTVVPEKDNYDVSDSSLPSIGSAYYCKDDTKPAYGLVLFYEGKVGDTPSWVTKDGDHFNKKAMVRS